VKLARAESGPRAEIATHGRTVLPDSSTHFQFGTDYLKDGYFEMDSERLRAQELDRLSIEIAKLLGNKGMKSHQLRRFFNKARGIQAKLDQEKDFDRIIADIYSLKRDVAYQVGRGVVPEEFQQFIEKNIELAVKKDTTFNGFMQHFESVLAYFVYYFREHKE
jgi:CRISPR-associated protein Csm2